MYREIVQFWFEEISPAQWWTKNEEFDRQIAVRFSDIHFQAARGELFEWRHNEQGRLAEIVVLDQFSRNIFRNSPQAFTNDQMALTLAQEAVLQGIDTLLPPEQRSFIYLPYMHSESLTIHQVAEELYRQPGLESGLEWELKHKAVIERFGRYPHRNEILGRESTAEELAFLRQPNSRF